MVGDEQPESKAAADIVKHLERPKGFCVDLECGSGLLSQALVQKTSLYVHAFESSDERVGRARKALRRFGTYGLRIHVEKGGSGVLPFPDHFVDLIVRGNLSGKGLDKAPWSEICRVLAPGGVAMIGSSAASGGPSLLSEDLAKRLKTMGVSAESVNSNGSWINPDVSRFEL